MCGAESGHDWSHVHRVWSTALKIARHEGGDKMVISLAALLHDIADHKFNHGDLDASGQAARNWLSEIKIDPRVAEKVADIVDKISFKGAATKGKMATIEGMIVQDADRLDAIGAIGIARAFSYGGFLNRKMYDPDIPLIINDPNSGASTTINHFYEKLLLLKDGMHTSMAKEMAEKRHVLMKVYIEEFLREWGDAS